MAKVAFESGIKDITQLDVSMEKYPRVARFFVQMTRQFESAKDNATLDSLPLASDPHPCGTYDYPVPDSTPKWYYYSSEIRNRTSWMLVSTARQNMPVRKAVQMMMAIGWTLLMEGHTPGRMELAALHAFVTMDGYRAALGMQYSMENLTQRYFPMFGNIGTGELIAGGGIIISRVCHSEKAVCPMLNWTGN
jgi:hypothetical protein